LQKKIKIVHLVGGNVNSGASKGAFFLNKLLNNHPRIISKILSEENIYKTKLNFKKLRFYYERLPRLLYPNRTGSSFSSATTGVNVLNNEYFLDADIIHLHWINHAFFNISDLRKINKPIVWTIRDMWTFTGGCHYTLNCNKFIKSCNSCPQLKSNMSYDLSTFNQNRKIRYLKNKNISFVTQSDWMTENAKKSKILKNEKIQTFYPSFDYKNFYYDYDKELKKRFNSKNNKKIILFGAQNLKAEYKGFKYFLKALKYLDKDKFKVIFFGNLLDNYELKKIGIEFINLGYLNNTSFLRKLYSISDVFVISSIQDGSPKTIIESLLCETPIVYFKKTSIDDFCKSKKIGGYGAYYCDSRDLANGIKWVSNKKDIKEITKKTKKLILKKFNQKDLTEKYVKLYEKIIK
tara:strand:- start:599 stop:1816 length:1218 start_codon:yes stop_codon:yes gene_type:complete